ncbi:hypothetical protein CRI94_17220 [Longibacter salinarum]|uniref:DUF6916 domain-containing protein n=1 Tax=Longibacter salinarum TaxID=1850348 RepID=A0A2A8CTJ9_9BACT|nr:hypothetical protein [Longibacter salinarum]PEN10395.1 hypothetical protein CRI94_17220 [Longibacter salinarum]
MDRSSHAYIDQLVGKDVLSRKVEHHELDGKEGSTYLVHIDEEHTVEITLDHIDKIDSDYVEGFSAIFVADAADEFPEGLYKVEPVDEGEPMALTLIPIMAMTQGTFQYQVTVGHLKKQADASIEEAPTPEGDDE